MSFIIEQGRDGVSPNFILTANKIGFGIETGETTIVFTNFDTGAAIFSAPANLLSAVANGATDITIQYVGGEKNVIDKLPIVNGIKIAGIDKTGSSQLVIIGDLNALFANAGGGVAPTITSPLTISVLVGVGINYVLAGTGIVSVIWTNLPSGTTPATGNNFNLIGGSALTAGVHTVNVEAINYHGTSGVITITITVSAVFTNTKSMYDGSSSGTITAQNTSMGASSPFYRPANGSGSSDAWTFVCWFKNINYYSQKLKLCYYGWSPSWATKISIQGNKSWCEMRYGSTNDYVKGTWGSTGQGGGWKMLAITYSGGDTDVGALSGSNNFIFYFNGAVITPTWVIGNTGYGGAMNHSKFGPELFEKGWMDEMAVFDVELSAANITTIYGGGTPIDLLAFSTIPVDYYRFGDGFDGPDTDISKHPTIYNMGTGTKNLTKTGTVADYVNDTPP